MKFIGNGEDTNVWFDKWVFDGTPRRPITIQPVIDLNLKVVDLIEEDNTWNLGKLQTLFPSADVTRTASWPPCREAKDSLVWTYTRDGNYTVKSGIWLITQLVYGMTETSPQIKASNH